MSEPVDREIRLALWKIHVLHHAARQPVWGLWMLTELAEHGHRVSPGTLYPILARMEANGWLRATDRKRGNARRTYRATAAGRRVLGRLRREIVELHREVVLGHEPEAAERRPGRRTKGGRSHGRR